MKLNCFSLIKLLNFINRRIILEDLNEKNVMWRSSTTNHNGNILRSLNYTNLILLNEGSTTRFSLPCYNNSGVKIALDSSEIAGKTMWRVLEDHGDNDHFPIIITANNVHKDGFTK